MLAMALALAAPAHAGQNLFVDDDNTDGFQCVGAPYHTINEALAVAVPGDEIHVCPGIYAEQVVLTQDINLRGEPFGTKRPVIKPTTLPATLSSFDGGNPIAAAVLIDSSLVRLTSIDIDLGDAAGTVNYCSPMVTGVYYHNGSGSLFDVHVSNAVLPLRPDCDSGIGLFVESGVIDFILGRPIFGRASVVVHHTDFLNYQKAGLVAHGPRTRVVVKDGSAIATQALAAPAAIPNGYEVAFGANGRLADIDTEDNVSLVAGRMGAGVLSYKAKHVSYRRVSATANQVGAFLVGDATRIRRSTMKDQLSDGMIVLGDSNLVEANELNGGSVSGCFINGNQNFLRGDFITNVPIGVWIINGSGNAFSTTNFGNVPFQERGVFGGLRDVTPATACPWSTRCLSPLSCDDGDACTVDLCDLKSGACSHAPLVCDDNNVCTADTCVSSTGCVYTPVPGTCTDGSVCTTGDTCVGGACVGTPIVCNDNNDCTTDTCDPLLGCQATPVADGTPCTTGTCTGGVCM
jgi:hypothetical protein